MKCSSIGISPDVPTASRRLPVPRVRGMSVRIGALGSVLRYEEGVELPRSPAKTHSRCSVSPPSGFLRRLRALSEQIAQRNSDVGEATRTDGSFAHLDRRPVAVLRRISEHGDGPMLKIDEP